VLQYSILFVVHAGEGIGLGHLRRSLVAARSLSTRSGAQVDFVVVGQSIDDALARDFKIHITTTTGPIDVVVNRLIKNRRYKAICLDLFNPLLVDNMSMTLANARTTGCKIIAIGSLSGFEGFIDLLYIPSFMPPVYSELAEFQGRLAFGWDSYLLNVRAKEQIPYCSGSILVLTGGSDVTRLGQDWPRVLDRALPSSSVVHWVTGPFSKSPMFPDSSTIEFIEHFAPVGLSTLMQGASVAISVFGVSFFELIAHRVPTVVFSPYGEKDHRELKGIGKQRIALVAQNATDAAQKAAILINDSDLRAELSNRARDKLKKFDGEYFAEEVKSLLTV
jgi:spore coat polysaccharide biosynthesis predicted glycosyltransferase SpsG